MSEGYFTPRDSDETAYEEHRARHAAWDREAEEEDAYDLNDPKHPRHHEVFAEISDSREETTA